MVYEVRRLRLLRELAAHGTIAAAAQACHLTPSAVSQQLGLLEREVGTPLLLRDGRRVVLTEAARVLVAHTERVLAELEEARAQVAGLTGEVRGTVRLGAFPSAAVALAAPRSPPAGRSTPTSVSSWTRPNPTSRSTPCATMPVTWRWSTSTTCSPDPRRGRGAAAPPPRAPPGGAAATEGPTALAELGDRAWIAPRSDTALRTVLERACQAAGFEPRIDYTSDDYTVIMSLVEAGVGVSLLPAWSPSRSRPACT